MDYCHRETAQSHLEVLVVAVVVVVVVIVVVVVVVVVVVISMPNTGKRTVLKKTRYFVWTTTLQHMQRNRDTIGPKITGMNMCRNQ